jgi:oligopeptide/dipeptide ABC transporter ATP-binding protein
VDNLLEVKNLQIEFEIEETYYKAVHDVSFSIRPGETLGLVGESGCGKSVTSLAIMRLLKEPTRVTGEILFNGTNLLGLSERQMCKVRGQDISMIFQEPMTSLNPLHKIGRQISESLLLHKGLTGKRAHEKSIELLKQVGIPRAEQIMHEYPHQLSGGMRQRVMIAIAMACDPSLLIADEPTTALDVTIQAQILDLMRKLAKEKGTSILLITHDLGVVAEMCNRVAVMYAGKIVEEGEVRQIFKNPQHPYTVGLLNSIPKIDGERNRLQPIEGNVPSLRKMPSGCRFAPRCPHAMEVCHQEDSKLHNIEDGHSARCWLYA